MFVVGHYRRTQFLVFLFLISLSRCAPAMPTPGGLDDSAAAILLGSTRAVVTSSGSGNPGSSLCNPCKIFITANNYRPAFDFYGINGVNSADTKCGAEAVTMSLSGTYKALIVDGTNRIACTSANCSGTGNAEHVDWVLRANTAYSQVN